jgi:hypothetical protein
MSVDVTKTEMICKAFDDAWAHLKNADDTLADPSKASVIRTVLARRIIEMAVGDGMTSGKLRDDAIAQAPHSPVPQPNFVPVSLRSSRITHNNGVAGGALVVAGFPFTVKLVAIASSLSPYGAKAVAGQHQSSGANEKIATGRRPRRRLLSNMNYRPKSQPK